MPYIVGAIALIGLVSTLLPMWSLTLQPDDLGMSGRTTTFAYGGAVFEYFDDRASVGGTASADVGVYDWFISAAPIAALVPIAFALAVAIAAVQIVRGTDHALWGATSAFALCAMVVVVSTAIRPASRRAVTGPLARELSARDAAAINEPMPMDVGIGAGFAVAVVALLGICALTGWQYVATASRRTTAP